MSKKLRGLLVAMLAAAAAFGAVPAFAAEPEFKVNGVVQGTVHQNVIQWGTLTMHSPFFGEIQCKVIVGAPVWNETTAKEGVEEYQGWEPFVCHMKECSKGSAFISAENAVELIERENTEKKIIYEAKRGASSLPWRGEPKIGTEQTRVLRLRAPEGFGKGLRFLVNCPGIEFEVPYEGQLEPRWINGKKNGLTPSHLVFEGQGGKTGHLTSPDIFPEEKNPLYIEGELTVLGAEQKLITVE